MYNPLFIAESQFTDVAYKLFMQNAQTGIMKKSGMQVNLQNSNIEQPILLVSKYITVYDIISFDTYLWDRKSVV